MKHCPTCNRPESDDALIFCRVDGTTLITGPSAGDDSSPTRILAGTETGETPARQTDPRPQGTIAARNQRPGSTTRTKELKEGRSISSVEYVVSGIKQHKFFVAILVIMLVAGAIGLGMLLHARSTEVAIDSIAVLPFDNQNHDSNIDYLSDGVTESIMNNLAQLPNLRVSPRSSVFRYKGKETDPLAAGKELGVRAVLTGRLQQRGDDVIISAELVDLRDSKQLWGEQYQRKMADLLSVQREIAREITNNLRPKLSGPEQNRATKQYTANPEAYQLYLKGRFYWNKRTVEDFRRATPYFQQAIDKDPNYALAQSGLADSYALLAAFSAEPPKELMPQAKAAAMKALALEDNLAEAHASLGQILMYYDWDFNGAEREFKRAIELNPNYATAHHWHAENLSALQRHDEALAEIRRALELDPLSLIINRVYGDMLLDARRYDEAIEQYRKTIEMDPNFPTTHAFLGRAYEAKGMYDQAVAEYLKFPGPRAFSPETMTLMKEAYAKSGWTGFVRARLTDLLERSKKEYVPAFSIASWYARLGQKDEVFTWLEKAYQERNYQMTQLKVRSEMDPVRSDPHYADLVRRVGLP
ncbi:MAG: tetratricopeptide repeat protein [bacterium]